MRVGGVAARVFSTLTLNSIVLAQVLNYPGASEKVSSSDKTQAKTKTVASKKEFKEDSISPTKSVKKVKRD
jgi:hypothetical protein